MKKKLKISFFIFISLFIVDQIIKYGFAHYDWDVDGSVMSLQLAYNRGVAFSSFAFLAEYLKYIQLTILVGATIYLYKNRALFEEYYISIALIYTGGLSNILDRFTYGAVVDYLYWHYGFEFAIFNFADVLINIAVGLIILKQILETREKKKQKI